MTQPKIRPDWAERLREERLAHGWTQEDVVRAMRALAERPLPEDLLTTYKRYERGKHFPIAYAALLAAVFGTDTKALFGDRRPAQPVVVATAVASGGCVRCEGNRGGSLTSWGRGQLAAGAVGVAALVCVGLAVVRLSRRGCRSTALPLRRRR